MTGGLASVLTSRLRALWGTRAEVTGVRPLPGGAAHPLGQVTSAAHVVRFRLPRHNHRS